MWFNAPVAALGLGFLFSLASVGLDPWCWSDDAPGTIDPVLLTVLILSHMIGSYGAAVVVVHLVYRRWVSADQSWQDIWLRRVKPDHRTEEALALLQGQ